MASGSAWLTLSMQEPISVSRRFVAETTGKRRTWQSAPLDDLDLGRGSSTACTSGSTASWWLSRSRRMVRNTRWACGRVRPSTRPCVRAYWRISRAAACARTCSLLVILDGALALHKAMCAVFGAAALIQRCQVHTLRNILDHLPKRQRPWVQAIVRRAYQASDVQTATRLLTDRAKRLGDEYPSAAGSVREGLDETLTVLTRHCSTRLQRSLATTTAVESLLSRTYHVKHNVKRWRGWTDDAAVGGHRCPRSCQGLPAPAWMRRYAAVGQRASRTRPTTGTRCLRGERRVESHPSRRRVSTAVGTYPLEENSAAAPRSGQCHARVLLRLAGDRVHRRG